MITVKTPEGTIPFTDYLRGRFGPKKPKGKGNYYGISGGPSLIEITRRKMRECIREGVPR